MMPFKEGISEGLRVIFLFPCSLISLLLLLLAFRRRAVLLFAVVRLRLFLIFQRRVLAFKRLVVASAAALIRLLVIGIMLVGVMMLFIVTATSASWILFFVTRVQNKVVRVRFVRVGLQFLWAGATA